MVEASEVKQAAAGRWPEILSVLGGIPAEILDGRHHPCPKCQGVDRFRMIDEKQGALFCNGCFSKENGDGLAALQWLTDESLPAVVRMLADHLGIETNGNRRHTSGPPADPIELVAKSKNITAEGLRKFGATVDGRDVVVPMHGPDGQPCSTMTLKPSGGKGLYAKGKSVGLFLPGRQPEPGESWCLVEGVKDAAALIDLGYLAAGLPGSSLAAKFAPMFRGAAVTIIPDRDTAGEEGSKKSAAVLHGHASVVKLAVLPAEFTDTGGADVRDVIAKEGADAVKMVIENAMEPAPKLANESTSTSDSAGYLRTDLGNAKRMARRHGRDMRYCHPWSRFFLWDGRRWAQDSSGEADRRAKETITSILREAAGEPDADRQKEMVKHAMRSQSAARVAAVLTLVKSEPPLPIQPEAFDQDAWVLNCQNGTLNLKTGSLRPHHREDYISKISPVEFDADATCPLWEDTLDRIFAGRPDMIDFIQRLAGYFITADTSEAILPIAWGVGANGKSTFVNALLGILGDDYSMQAPPDFLMVKRGESHPTAQADLFGRRLVACAETDDGRRLAESLVKMLTGGEKVRARRMREDFWQFDPTHKVLLATNHKPIIRGTDHGIWRRIKLIPFDVIIPDDQQDKQLGEKLKGDLPGILAWAVRGCLAWQREGLKAPEEVRAATTAYQGEQDVIGPFLEETCQLDEQAKIRAGALYGAYKTYTEKAGEHPLSQRRFGAAMTARGIERFKCDGVWYTGLGLLSDGQNTQEW